MLEDVTIMVACSRLAGYAGSTPSQSLSKKDGQWDVRPIAQEGPCQGNEQVLILLIKGVVSTLSTLKWIVYSHSFWGALGVLQLAITTTVRYKLGSRLLRQAFVVHLLAAPNLSTLERLPSTEAEP
ncbi:predicted protein [Chaetomium globosum CBS 148.51]|uniref:Uncharacterized protein n=1 Tax=Chaetomium globosum (strain ATCC 6205 / CBS 148.51 / DSM 1962 / NBRC 6347 / NRRL 1970) TaxID=306901 RepID=Q2GPI0_CHAGB|nr:uncharacterized protein CHGG_10124 [Chaetomium globosum CBS 148.51]EAQ83720.1 predicted protein [Chaetomium globosum CBS 148.51]